MQGGHQRENERGCMAFVLASSRLVHSCQYDGVTSILFNIL